MSNEKEVAQTVQPQEPVKITLNDLLLSLRAIEVAQERGAYKLEEMQAVGAIGMKLRTFLQQNADEEKEESTEGDTEPKAE